MVNKVKDNQKFQLIENNIENFNLKSTMRITIQSILCDQRLHDM